MRAIASESVRPGGTRRGRAVRRVGELRRGWSGERQRLPRVAAGAVAGGRRTRDPHRPMSRTRSPPWMSRSGSMSATAEGIDADDDATRSGAGPSWPPSSHSVTNAVFPRTATPLFGGVRGAQVAGRASLVECGAFPARLGTCQRFKDDHRSGSRPGPETRTGPGHSPASPPTSANAPPAESAAPSRLIRQAAITAIVDGTEHITNRPRPGPPRPPRRNPAPPRHHHRVPHTPAVDTPWPCNHAKPCDLHKHGPGL